MENPCASWPKSKVTNTVLGGRSTPLLDSSAPVRPDRAGAFLCPFLPAPSQPFPVGKRPCPYALSLAARCPLRRLEHLTLEMLAYGRQKPAFSHFVARIFKKILAEQLAHFIR